jgi:hypothetical protein
MFVRKNSSISLCTCVLGMATALETAWPFGTAFTFQGQLKASGVPVHGWIDTMLFELFASQIGGNPLGAQTLHNVPVLNGLFTVEINTGGQFGPNAFNGDERWLAITINGASLTTRHRLNAAPYAHAAKSWKTSGSNVVYTEGRVGIATTTPATTLDVAGSVRSGIAGGNTLTMTGTSDPQTITSSDALEFYVGGKRLLRLEPEQGLLYHGPNLIGGYDRNIVDLGVVGATIAGGGGFQTPPVFPPHVDELPNRVSADLGTVGGGFANHASGHGSTVGGGWGNNSMGTFSGIPGGYQNIAGGDYSFAAGFRAKVRSAIDVGDDDGDEGTFVWSDASSHPGGDRFVSTGPNQFLVQASGGIRLATGDGTTPQFQAVLPSTLGSPHVLEDLALQPLGGNVGVGIINPSTKLHVLDALRIDEFGSYAEVRCNGAGGTSAAPTAVTSGLGLARYGAGGYDGSAYSPTRAAMEVLAAENWTSAAQGTNLRFTTTAIGGLTGGVRMHISDAGNVGVGRTPAANRLEVNGNASKSTAGDWLANSDRAIKEQVRSVSNALSVIERLRPVVFRYTDEYKAKHPSVKDQDYYNYVAQEFREVFPGSVQDSGDDGLLQMDSHPANVYSVAAIQELHQLVQEKDCEIDQLRSEIADLRDLINKLAAR